MYLHIDVSISLSFYLALSPLSARSTAAHSSQSHKTSDAADGARNKTKQQPNSKKAVPAKSAASNRAADVEDESTRSVNARLHDRVVKFCLKHMDAILAHHVPADKKGVYDGHVFFLLFSTDM